MTLVFPETATDLDEAYGNAIATGTMQIEKPKLATFFGNWTLRASERRAGAIVRDFFVSDSTGKWLTIDRLAHADEAKLSELQDASQAAQAAALAAEEAKEAAAAREEQALAAADTALAARETLAKEAAAANQRLAAEKAVLARERKQLGLLIKELDAQPGDRTMRQEALRRAFAAYEKETGS